MVRFWQNQYQHNELLILWSILNVIKFSPFQFFILYYERDTQYFIWHFTSCHHIPLVAGTVNLSNVTELYNNDLTLAFGLEATDPLLCIDSTGATGPCGFTVPPATPTWNSANRVCQNVLTEVFISSLFCFSKGLNNFYGRLLNTCSNVVCFFFPINLSSVALPCDLLLYSYHLSILTLFYGLVYSFPIISLSLV